VSNVGLDGDLAAPASVVVVDDQPATLVAANRKVLRGVGHRRATDTEEQVRGAGGIGHVAATCVHTFMHDQEISVFSCVG
jgi:hypothetical protein